VHTNELWFVHQARPILREGHAQQVRTRWQGPEAALSQERQLSPLEVTLRLHRKVGDAARSSNLKVVANEADLVRRAAYACADVVLPDDQHLKAVEARLGPSRTPKQPQITPSVEDQVLTALNWG